MSDKTKEDGELIRELMRIKKIEDRVSHLEDRTEINRRLYDELSHSLSARIDEIAWDVNNLLGYNELPDLKDSELGGERLPKDVVLEPSKKESLYQCTFVTHHPYDVICTDCRSVIAYRDETNTGQRNHPHRCGQ